MIVLCDACGRQYDVSGYAPGEKVRIELLHLAHHHQRTRVIPGLDVEQSEPEERPVIVGAPFSGPRVVLDRLQAPSRLLAADPQVMVHPPVVTLPEGFQQTGGLLEVALAVFDGAFHLFPNDFLQIAGLEGAGKSAQGQPLPGVG